MVFHTGLLNPSSPGDGQVASTKEFRDAYEPVQVEGETPYRYVAVIWVRIDSPRIGIQRTKDAIVIPTYLFNRARGTIARLDDQGQLAVEVSPLLPAPERFVDLDCGTWRIAADAHGLPLTFELTGENGFTASGKNALEVRIPNPGRYLITIRPATESPVFLHQIKLTKAKHASALNGTIEVISYSESSRTLPR
jgi:hypothetical protein